MEKNIENNTENKFGNFLNFMKKFLAMSFSAQWQHSASGL